jgi:protein-disulfide isomerase
MFIALAPIQSVRVFEKETTGRRGGLGPPVTIDEHDHVLGPRDAGIMMVQYGDYTCPHSAQVHWILEELVARFSQRVALAWRHFPSPQRDPLAGMAAEAAEAAACRGLFWAMHRRLMADRGVSDAGFFTWHAAAVGMDVWEFGQAMERRAYAPVVKSHVEAARRHGVRQAGGLFINGILREGPADRKSVQRAIEDAERVNRR